MQYQNQPSFYFLRKYNLAATNRYMPDDLTNDSTDDEAKELPLQDEEGPLRMDPSHRGQPRGDKWVAWAFALPGYEMAALQGCGTSPGATTAPF
ncbi:MAG: hypothetical protein GY696_01885 [Gammaproteobacteria bacterium]|nr:hypothetical protein [Gammaproteobacteria bacterium]